MSDNLRFEIQASKSYFILVFIVYLATLFSAWYYFYNIWISLAISVILSMWLAYFLPRFLQLKHPNSIVEIALNEGSFSIKKNDQSARQYFDFHLQYQSNFLVIIRADKNFVVIFKDAIAGGSLSQINRYFNAHS
ncbi:MAG: hypothetical protein FXV80_04900 [Candidatus Thioglobus sp.]|nr:MAG: hypothetical protein FXV80_04900 [Candidatus Thioglobus sp.]